MPSHTISKDQDDFLKLIRILCVDLGVPINKVEMDASLGHDFGIAGMDGWELMERIKREFEVDMTEDDYLPYFDDELPYNPFRHMLDSIRGIDRANEIPRLELGRLLKIIKDRHWS
jgi:hypothetical protein